MKPYGLVNRGHQLPWKRSVSKRRERVEHKLEVDREMMDFHFNPHFLDYCDDLHCEACGICEWEREPWSGGVTVVVKLPAVQRC